MMSRPMTVAVVAITVASLAVVGLVAGTAGGGAAGGATPVSNLADITGRWVPVDDTGAPAPVAGTMSLTFADGFVLVETGCNTGRGGASVEDSRLVVEELATTRKACVPPLGEQEAWVLDMVTNSPRMELAGPTLSLYWGEGEDYRLSLALTSTGPSI